MKFTTVPLPPGSVSSLALYLSEASGVPVERCAVLLRQGSVWLGTERVREETWANALGKGSPHAPAAELALEFRVCLPELPIEEAYATPGQIAYEDEDFLIVYKPGAQNTCPSVYSDIDCLSWAVQKMVDEADGTVSDFSRPVPDRQVRAINRLDRDTEGLVFLSKNKAAEIALHGMFMKRRVSKRYLAWVKGRPDFSAGRIFSSDRALIRDSLSWRGKEKEAESRIGRLSVPFTRALHAGSESDSLCVVMPATGRTHQIRKHCAYYLGPIIGDSVYGGYPRDGRLMLACVSYRFRHPFTGRSVSVHRIPEDFFPDISRRP